MCVYVCEYKGRHACVCVKVRGHACVCLCVYVCHGTPEKSEDNLGCGSSPSILFEVGSRICHCAHIPAYVDSPVTASHLTGGALGLQVCYVQLYMGHENSDSGLHICAQVFTRFFRSPILCFLGVLTSDLVVCRRLPSSTFHYERGLNT